MTLLPPIVGIDDATHYQANIAAYKQSIALSQPAKKQLAAEERSIAEKKQTIFNPELKAFDAKVQDYQKGLLNLGDYLKDLSLRAERSNLSLPSGKDGLLQSPYGLLRNDNLVIFLEALSLEESLNFTRVELERARLIDALAAKLNKNQMDDLLNHSVAFRMGQINHAAFYQYLRTTCSTAGIPLQAYKAMNSYIQYVLLSDAIDVEKITQEVNTLEKDTYTALAKTDAEKQLVTAARQVYLTGKLLDFALTTEEWQEYKNMTPSPLGGEGRVRGMSTFENFYKHAEIRDHLIAENLLKAMEQHQAKRVVLVTGGFHSKGIRSVIARSPRRPKQSVVSFTPKITKLDTENSYLSAFAQEKTPLEKLFAGEKLFLSPKPMVDPSVFALHAVGLNEALDPKNEMPPTQNQADWNALNPSAQNVTVDAKDTSEGFTATAAAPQKVELAAYVDRSSKIPTIKSATSKYSPVLAASLLMAVLPFLLGADSTNDAPVMKIAGYMTGTLLIVIGILILWKDAREFVDDDGTRLALAIFSFEIGALGACPA